MLIPGGKAFVTAKVFPTCFAAKRKIIIANPT